MLRAANQLTAEDLEYVRGKTSTASRKLDTSQSTVSSAPVVETEPVSKEGPASEASMSQGQRELLRTRESKVSTACLGAERAKHEWWPVGTELIGRMREQTFTAEVVENPRVKSNRSLLITSGPA